MLLNEKLVEYWNKYFPAKLKYIINGIKISMWRNIYVGNELNFIWMWNSNKFLEKVEN